MSYQKVIWAAGFGIQQSSKTRSIGFCAEQSPTIVGGAIHGVVLITTNEEQKYELPKSNRSIDGKQSSRKLLRTGCI